jgi:hypothetical protein
MHGSLFFIAFMALIMSTVAFLPTRSVQTGMELNARHGMKNWRSVTAGRIRTEAVNDKKKWEASKAKWEAKKTPAAAPANPSA